MPPSAVTLRRQCKGVKKHSFVVPRHIAPPPFILPTRSMYGGVKYTLFKKLSYPFQEPVCIQIQSRDTSSAVVQTTQILPGEETKIICR